MTYRDLYEIQDLVFRACVRNTMFVATLPFDLMQDMCRRHAPEGGPSFARRRGEDPRWLR